MAPSSLASRGKDGRVSIRSRRSDTSSRRHSSKPAPEDEEPKKPDIDELRQRRAAYFAKPVAERQKVIKPETSHVVSGTMKGFAAIDGEHRRKKRPSKSSTSKTTTPVRSKNVESLSADYVYGAPPILQAEDKEHRRRDSSDATRKRRHSRHSSSHRHNVAQDLDLEVTPDDSISVVAERKAPSARHRPALQRASTTSTKLAPITEMLEAPSVTSSRRTPKRESTILGNLLRRQSTSAVPSAPRLIECLTCGSDDIPHAHSAKLACGHRMCHECLKRVFDMSVKDPAHMPPRCCTDDHIPLKHVDKLFDLKFKVLWNRKYQEYNTKNRVYCPAPKCGEWIKPSHIHRNSEGRKYAHCPRCKTKVCTLCNNKMHKQKDCPDDPEVAKLVEQAKKEGWQRCFKCSSMVELKEGCNHMTCRCLAEFCMVCGSKWKTCECPWFAYTNLPNPNALTGMRVAEPIQVLYRRVYNANNPQQPQQGAPPPEHRPVLPRERTYQEELDHRRRQERLDGELARRLQLASLMENEDQPPEAARRIPHMDTWGLGNAAEHFLNDDFVRNAANVVMSAFGDANMGRRGERASGRRRRARLPEQPAGENGLVPNFLGDESVLGMAPSRPTRAPE